MANRAVETFVPLTPKSVARFAAAYAAVQQAQAAFQTLVQVTVDAMGVEGQVIDVNLKDARLTVMVPGLYPVGSDEAFFSGQEPSTLEGDFDAIHDLPNEVDPDYHVGCDAYCTHTPTA